MADPLDEQHLEPYREAVRRFGPGFEATLWGSEEAQVLRFGVFADLAGFDECAILDVGCGRGDFAAYLLDHGVPFARYIGIDAVPEIIHGPGGALERNLPRCEFEVRNVLADLSALKKYEADYICISGTLNTMEEPVAMRLVKAAFEAAVQGVIFNFLSDRYHERWGAQSLGPARRFETIRWLDWTMNLSSRISFTQDYLDGHDATIMIRHE